MKILITGIHGFVGSNLVNALSEFHTIYGLDILCPHKDGVIKTFLWNELDDIPAVDVIIHLAGIAHDTKNNTKAKHYFDVNTGLTQKMYDRFVNSDAEKFVYISSVKAAADSVVGFVLTENVMPNPVGPYGESKIAAENYILSQQSLLKKQKKIYILRPCMIYGLGNKGNFNLLYHAVKNGIPYPLGAFENQRSFCSMANMNFVMRRLIEDDVDSGIFNVCDDDSLSSNQLIYFISSFLRRPCRIWNWNKSLVFFLAKVGTVFQLPFNSERLHKLTENYIVSNEKLKNALGIKQMPFSAKEEIMKTIKSFEKS